MPVFKARQLHAIATRILHAAGACEQDADIVASELRDANLVGHDSHGVIRLMQYVNDIESGHINLNTPIEVLKERPAYVLIDGHFNFGQVCATRALRLGMDKARAAGTATVMVRDTYHVGRVGSYTQKAARAGFAAICAVNAPCIVGGVAPYGGIQRRLGTNPVSIAAPWGDSTIVLDMTTSASAEGKVRVARQKGEQLPEGWIIDAQGNPSTEPEDFYAGGALLPLGGALGFKGYGMAFMVDILCGIVGGSGLCRADVQPGSNGMWMTLIDVEQFVDKSAYETLLSTYVAHVKSSRKMEGVEEILLPGEIELRRQAQRSEHGVEVPDETWRQISQLARKLGVQEQHEKSS